MNSSNPNFQCSLDGYQKMTQKAFNAVLTPLNLAVELLPTLIGYIGKALGSSAAEDLNRAFRLFYQYFTMTLPGSAGYMVSAAFFITKALGYGSYMCEASGYLFYVIYYADYLNELLSQLSNSSDGSGPSS